MDLLRKRALFLVLALVIAGCSTNSGSTTTATTSTTVTTIPNLQPYTDTAGTLAT